MCLRVVSFHCSTLPVVSLYCLPLVDLSCFPHVSLLPTATCHQPPATPLLLATTFHGPVATPLVRVATCCGLLLRAMSLSYVAWPLLRVNDLSLVLLRVVRLFYVPGASTACREPVLRVVALDTCYEPSCHVQSLCNASCVPTSRCEALVYSQGSLKVHLKVSQGASTPTCLLCLNVLLSAAR